jgi:FAD/FMN-containing dehydrogenase
VATIPKELSASLRNRFGDRLLQERPRVVIAPTCLEDIVATLEIARRERFKLLPLGTGSSFPPKYPNLRDNLIAILMGSLEGSSGGDAFFTSYWAGTKLQRLSAEYPGLFDGEKQRATLGGFIAEQPVSSLMPSLSLFRRLLLSVEVLTASGDVEIFGGESTGTIQNLSSSHLLFGSRGHLGILLKVQLRRGMPSSGESSRAAEKFGTPFVSYSTQPAFSRSQLQELLDPGGLFAWRREQKVARDATVES